MSFAYAGASLDEAEAVLFGAPSENGSHADRKGSKEGPAAIRRASERNLFGKGRLVQSQYGGALAKLYDAGDKARKDIADFVAKLAGQGMVPVMLGGDHSLTVEALKGLTRHKKPTIVYFDAHPDCIASERGYFGSVIPDTLDLLGMRAAKVILVGIRAPESEEFQVIKDRHVHALTAGHIEEIGVAHALREIEKHIAGPVYLSVDLDVADPAFAPGVSTPFPGGLSARELAFLVSRLSQRNLVGMDVMELVPKHDDQERTAHLATVLIAEALAGMKRR